MVAHHTNTGELRGGNAAEFTKTVAPMKGRYERSPALFITWHLSFTAVTGYEESREHLVDFLTVYLKANLN